MNRRSLAVALAVAGSLLFGALGRATGAAAPDDEAAAAARSRLIPVSDPATDFDFSRLGGFSQISPSVAWCGRRVVVGYEDTGSLFETAFTPEDGAGVIGVALSEDSGRTFLDLGPLPPGPPDHFLDTEPAVVCAGPGVFYLSASRLVATGPELQVGYSVSRSVDGGRTWADPVDAVLKGDLDHTPVSGR